MSAFVTRRTRALAALIVAVLSLSALPSMAFDVDTVGTASAAATEYEVKVGWMSEIVNWNPMYIAMVEDWVSTFLMYSALWQYDEDWGSAVPDLVTSYNATYHPDGTMTMWLGLTHNAYFRNSADPNATDRQLNAWDVSYTFWAACSRTDTAWEYYLRDYDVHVIDDFTLRLDIDYVKATAIDDITGIPIVSAGFYNGSISLKDSMDPDECYGSGPFTFHSWLEASWYKFKAAPNYHGESDYGDERKVKITYVTYSLASTSAILASDMNGGNLDVAVLSGEPDVFINTLNPTETNKMVKEIVQELGICDIAVNAIPPEFRLDPPGEGGDYCDGNLHLLDREVRKALLMTLDKAYIQSGIMKNLSVIADSVIMPSFWKKDIEGVLPFDPDAARDVLLAAGYYDDGGPFLVAGPNSYVVNHSLLPEGSRLEGLRCQAPNTDPSYADIAIKWLSWAADAGIGFDPALTGEEQEGVMTNEAWYKCMYDIWVWHWGWGPEPLSDLSVWQTAEIVTGGDNCQMPMGEWWVHGDMDTNGDGTIDEPQNYTTCPYVNASMIEEFGMDEDGFRGFASFDQNASTAMRTIDIYDRREIVYDLQQMVYDSYCESPPYYDVGLYAYSEARYQGWGDWSQHSGRTVVSGMPWLWFDLISAENLVPSIDSGLASSYDLSPEEVGNFAITVSDPEGDLLWVNWSFGDGSDPVEQEYPSTATPVEASTTHSYDAEGTYTVTVTVTDGYMYHTQTDSAPVNVADVATLGPRIEALTYDPLSAYVDEETTWRFTVYDDDSTDIRVTIAWGDGTYSVNNSVEPAGTRILVEKTHTYSAAATYSVVISASDGTNNNSATPRTYEVIANSPPAVPVVSTVSTNEDVWTPVSATTSDPDPDTLTVTWDWGDGTFNVTTHSASSSVESSVYHMWDTPGDYEFTVYVDDGFEEAGHNVSATGTATVTPTGTQTPPTILSLVPASGYVDELLTITISAFDSNGDALDFYVEFGDGDAATGSTPAGSGTQTVEMEHTYTAVDDYTIDVYVNDGTDNVTDDYTISITEAPVNAVPEILLMVDYSAMYNESVTITPIQVFDADGDELSVWFDWGDETTLTAGDAEADYAASHVYSVTGNVTLTVHVDDNTGLTGHNASATANVTIGSNRRPSMTGSLGVSPAGPYLVGDTITFTVTVTDLEGNTVTVKADFGDDSDVESEVETLSGPGANVTVTFTHAFESADSFDVVIWAEDEFDHPDPTWISVGATVDVEDIPDEGGDINWVLIAGIGVLLIVVIAVAAMLLKKRKGKAGGDAGEGSGGMEGMAPPEETA